MARIISASIDVTKIDKSKLVEGKKGKYLNIDIVINDEKNDYGQDTGIKISQSQEERQAKASATYIGNGKTVWQSDAAPQNAPAVEDEGTDDLPF